MNCLYSRVMEYVRGSSRRDKLLNEDIIISEISIKKKNLEELKWSENLLVESGKVKERELKNIENEINDLKLKIEKSEVEQNIINMEIKKINNNIISIREKSKEIEDSISKIRMGFWDKSKENIIGD